MAIEKDYIHRMPDGHSIEYKDAYWEVYSFTGSDKEEILCSLHIKTEKGGAAVGVMNFSFKTDISGESYRAQAYNYLMSLEMFEGCEAI